MGCLGIVVGIIAIIVVISVATGTHHSSPSTTKSSSSNGSSTALTDPTMGPRTRKFVGYLRNCQGAVRLLGVILQQNASDRVQLATSTKQAREICGASVDAMRLADTSHFSDQAIDAEIAVTRYQDGLKKIADYVDTLTPSDVPDASDDFANARGLAATAIREINQRRVLYGFGNI